MKKALKRIARRPAGLGVTAGLAVASLALIDQLFLGWTDRNVQSHYGRFGLHPDPSVLTMVMLATGISFAASMAVVAHQQRRGHSRGARWSAGSIALVWSGLAALASSAHEYDGFVLGPMWRVVPWMLPAAAVVAATTIRNQSTI